MDKQREATHARRGELARRYRETKRPVGIYAIRNVVNQRVYVAGSTNLQGAMNRDRFELKLKGHRNARLQADWIEHGEANFRFEVIDTIGKDAASDLDVDFKGELEALLELWRAELRCYGERGYNMRIPSPWLGRAH